MRKYLNINEIQIEELKIIEKVVDFLDKNNIKYYIGYGTLLGAVRHKGFIPWDDDIDLFIIRDEYDKLIKILNKNNKISNNLEAIAFELGNSDWPFLKIINKNIGVYQRENCDKNLWIDIFPLDKAINKKNKGYNKIMFLRKIFISKRIEEKNKEERDINYMDLYKEDYDNNLKIKRILKEIKSRDIKINQIMIKTFYKIKIIIESLENKILNIIFKNIKYENIIKKYINECKKNNDKNTEYYVENVWGNVKMTFKREWFKDKKMKFENIYVNGVKDYNKCLETLYGDYMKLPPKEKRMSHNIKAYRIEKDNE